jgi:hypothetical protein
VKPLQAVESGAERTDGADRLPQHLGDLDQLPALLSAKEMAALFRIGVSHFHKLAKRGAFDKFKVVPAIGPKCYSGVLVARYLKGEAVYTPSFGRKRAI